MYTTANTEPHKTKYRSVRYAHHRSATQSHNQTHQGPLQRDECLTLCPAPEPRSHATGTLVIQGRQVEERRAGGRSSSTASPFFCRVKLTHRCIYRHVLSLWIGSVAYIYTIHVGKGQQHLAQANSIFNCIECVHEYNLIKNIPVPRLITMLILDFIN